MLNFLERTPLSPDLHWTRDRDYLFHFEAQRNLLVNNLILKSGLTPADTFEVLDFGYLHGLTQEFLHRGFPGAKITVCDLPSSPIFEDKGYMQSIRERGYLELIPSSIDDVLKLGRQFKVIMLGEIIEHLDPTQVAKMFENLRKVMLPGGLLIITTPNASGLYNCLMTLTEKDGVQAAPIPEKTFGYGHIHLWSPKVLKQTAQHFGWNPGSVEFYHGREGEKFEEVNSAWVSLKAQILIRAIKFLGNKFPKMRGFMVASFSPK